jgi:mannose-6-phosphate isomerase-like protein (cupin superfamily)
MSVPDVTALRLADGVLAPAGSRLALAEWTAQGSAGPEPLYQAPLHSHPEDEAWYVLSGTLRIRVGDQQTQISAGGAVVVPGGIAHTYWNPRPEPARYVLVMGASTLALIQAIHATDDRSPATMRRLFAEHGATLLES